jgi:hypothetical protein
LPPPLPTPASSQERELPQLPSAGGDEPSKGEELLEASQLMATLRKLQGQPAGNMAQ